MLAAMAFASSAPVSAEEQRSAKPRPLHACALSDFVDEASGTKHLISESHLKSLMKLLKGAGIKTLSWGYYADADGGHLVPKSMQSVTNTSLREHVPTNRLLAYPANMDVQWKRWIELDLPDEAVIRHFGFNFDQIMKDARTVEIVSMLHEKRIPVFFNRYMRNHEKHRFLKDIDTIRSRPEYTGYVFYEVYSYVNYNADGTCTFKYPEIVRAIRHAAQGDAGE
jgi:hypothetical protein